MGYFGLSQNNTEDWRPSPDRLHLSFHSFIVFLILFHRWRFRRKRHGFSMGFSRSGLFWAHPMPSAIRVELFLHSALESNGLVPKMLTFEGAKKPVEIYVRSISIANRLVLSHAGGEFGYQDRDSRGNVLGPFLGDDETFGDSPPRADGPPPRDPLNLIPRPKFLIWMDGGARSHSFLFKDFFVPRRWCWHGRLAIFGPIQQPDYRTAGSPTALNPLAC